MELEPQAAQPAQFVQPQPSGFDTSEHRVEGRGSRWVQSGVFDYRAPAAAPPPPAPVCGTPAGGATLNAAPAGGANPTAAAAAAATSSASASSSAAAGVAAAAPAATDTLADVAALRAARYQQHAPPPPPPEPMEPDGVRPPDPQVRPDLAAICPWSALELAATPTCCARGG